jgi:catechol 2,3-dioxygenase-like lactoylglutathione lyase family enzyme
VKRVVKAEGDEMKLNLVVIRATDIVKSVAFYESLGMKFVEEQHGKGPKHYSFNLAGTIFEIYPADGARTEAIRLGFTVPKSLIDLISQLETAGVAIISPPKDSPWGRRAAVTDPDGNRIELCEESP